MIATESRRGPIAIERFWIDGGTWMMLDISPAPPLVPYSSASYAGTVLYSFDVLLSAGATPLKVCPRTARSARPSFTTFGLLYFMSAYLLDSD